jgi:hypothetical protein
VHALIKRKEKEKKTIVLFQWLKEEELKANFVLLPLLRTYKFTQRRYGFNRQKEKKNIVEKKRTLLMLLLMLLMLLLAQSNKFK